MTPDLLILLRRNTTREPLQGMYTSVLKEAFALLKEPVLADPVSQADEFQRRIYVLTLVHIVAGGDNVRERLWK